MDWGLSIVASENETFAYYWRKGKALFVQLSPNEHFLSDPESGLMQVAAEMGLRDVHQLFQGEGMVRLSTSYLLDLLRNGKGLKIGAILNENALESLTEEEKRYLPLTGDNVAFISESVNMNGQVEQDIKGEEVINAFRDLLKVGVHSVVVSLKNSWMFPKHERQIRATLTENYPSRYLGGLPIYLSSDFEPEYGESEAKNLTTINAYVQPIMRKYLFDLEQKLRELGYRGGLFLANRYGGLSRWDRTRAIDTADSVFRATLAGAEVLAIQHGIKNALVLSVDAYSTSLGIIRDGAVVLSNTDKVLGVPINAHAAEKVSVPAGVKSKIRVTSGKIFFDNDGRDGITLMDIDNILGYRAAEADKNLINQFEDEIAKPLGKNTEEVALAVRHSFVSWVSDQALSYLSGEGIDMPRFTLLPGNGSAGAYCWDMGKALRVSQVRLFSSGEYLGAFGLSSMGLRHLYQTSANIRVDSDFSVKDMDGFSRLIQDAFYRLNLDMISEGFSGRDPTMTLKLISRAHGEGLIEFTTPMESSDKRAIEKACEACGRDLKDRLKEKVKNGKIHLIGITLMGSLPLDSSLESPITPKPKEGVPEKGKNMAYWEDTGLKETPSYVFSTVRPGDRIAGPAILQGRYSYCLLPPKAEMEITEDLNGILEVN